MAKTQQREGNEYVALPRGVIETLNEGEPVSDEEAAFDEFVSGMSAERMGEIRVGKIKVAKDGTPIANTKSAHCFSAPIDQFTYSALLEHIRARHGAGLYRVVGVEAGKRGLVFNRLLEIAEELNPPKPEQESALQNPANVLESVGRIMAESQARTEGLIARITEARAVPAVDPMDSMMKMATMFSTMMGSMAGMFKGGGGGGSGDILDQAEKLLKLKELLGGSGGGDSGAESNFFDVVKAGLQSFGPALGALALKSQQGQPAALPPPQPTFPPPQAFAPPVSPAPQPPGLSPQAQGTDPMFAQLKTQVDILVTNARNGADPGQLAEVILRMTPDNKLDDLGNMLDAPDMVDKMAAVNPEVQNHRDFFEKLRGALLALLEPAEETTLPPNAPTA